MVKTGKTISEIFIVTKELGQGRISPTLFKIFIEITLEKWKDQC